MEKYIIANFGHLFIGNVYPNGKLSSSNWDLYSSIVEPRRIAFHFHDNTGFRQMTISTYHPDGSPTQLDDILSGKLAGYVIIDAFRYGGTLETTDFMVSDVEFLLLSGLIDQFRPKEELRPSDGVRFFGIDEDSLWKAGVIIVSRIRGKLRML